MSVLCHDCGRKNEDGAAFCDNCGVGLRSGCPDCGLENRPDAKFCRNCGARLAGAQAGAAPSGDQASAGRTAGTAGTSTPVVPTAAERRLVSVLFADLVAFTSYSEGRDPELVRETLTRYFDATRAVIERHGGVVEKFIGDAVMAEWGAPRTNEDDAERAVRAALEIVGAVRDLGEGLAARVGVLTGQAAVTLGATDQGMVAGDLVNTAARLQAAAPPDTVLVGEATMQAASGAVAFEEVGEQALKGKAAPVRAWRAVRVVGDTRGRGRSDAIEPPFVGRELELRLLKDYVNAARTERRPRLISITGPAGIGKSRLAWEFEKYADGLVERIYWHRGRSPSYGEGIAFWALGEMVRRRARLVEGDDEPTTRERIHATVAEFIEPADADWIERALLALLGLEPPPPGGREALFAAWRTFFERVARSSTTVLLFEDLHWADDGQLDFIDHLLEWSRDVPLLVVTLARPELLERRPGWGTSARSFNAIGLEPLTDAQMRELITGLVPELPEATVAQVLARADGIPLYAVETVRSLVADGRLSAGTDGTFRPSGDLGELAIPDTLRALVASRLDSLGAEDRTLIADATVLGKTFDHRVLAAVAGEDADRTEARLRVLVKRELLEVSVDPRSPERGQYGFVQSIIREVAYETLSRRDRRARHLAAARYFEAEGDEELASVLAAHYLAALEASEEGPEAAALRVQARLALRGAAERATRLGAPEQAVTHIESALRITDDPGERAPLLLRAADAAQMAAQLERATGYARSAVSALGEAADERAALAASATLAALLLDQGLLDEAVAMLETTVAEAEPYAEVQADLLAALARALMRQSREPEAVTTADRALTIAEPRRLDRIVAEALGNKGAAIGRMGRLREARALLEAAASLAAEVGDVSLELRVRSNLGAFLASHDLREAKRTWQAAAELATRLGQRKALLWLRSVDTNTTVDAAGDWDEAVRLIDEALDEVRDPVTREAFLGNRLWYQILRGEDTAATWAEERALREAHPDIDQSWGAPHVRGLELLLAGRPHEAAAVIREVAPTMGQAADQAYAMLLLVAFSLGDPAVMREAQDHLVDGHEMGNGPDGMRELATCGVAALDGRPEEALASARKAVSLLEAAGWDFTAAQARLFVLMVLPDRPELAGWAADARAVFERVGARPLLRLLDAFTTTADQERVGIPS